MYLPESISIAYNDFFVKAFEKAEIYFSAHYGIRIEEVSCAMPAYLNGNLLALVKSHPHLFVNEKFIEFYKGTVPGYENKLVFFSPFWFYSVEVKPLSVEIPGYLIANLPIKNKSI